MIKLLLMGFVVLFFLILFFFVLSLILSVIFGFFNFLEEELGESTSKLLFALSGIAGFFLLFTGWFQLKVHYVQIGALLVVTSTLYFLSESVKPLS